ncbi:MAG: C45 family peptidase [Minisyncoccia bacterium]
MKIEKFKGKNSFEIGQEFGKIYKKEGYSVDWIKIDKKIFAKQMQIYKKHFPSFLEEIKGIANSGNYDLDKLTYSFIAEHVSWEALKNKHLRHACSIFGYKEGKNLFVGRNYDWIPVTENIFRCEEVINKQKYSYIAISDMHIIKHYTKPKYQLYFPIDAINEKGLFIGLTASINEDWSFGLPSMHIIKLIAEDCKNVKEAINIFKQVPLNCAKNFFIADSSGNMAVIEHFSGLDFKVLKPKDNILIKTNHYNDPKFAKKDMVLKHRPTITTFLRYYEALMGINTFKDKFKQEDIIKILNNKDSYLLQNSPNVRSIWTLSLNMTKKKYLLYYDLFGKKKSIKLKI